MGTLEVFKKYFKPLCKSVRKNKNLHAIDCLYLGFAPFLQILILLTTIGNFLLIPNFKLMLLGGVLSYLGTIFLSVFMISYYKKDIKKSLKGILLFPLFTVSGILAALKATFMPSKNWEEIKHTRKINIKNILEDK